MKLILNKCYGGFDVSKEAYMLYAKKNQKGLWGEVDPYWDYIDNKSIYA